MLTVTATGRSITRIPSQLNPLDGENGRDWFEWKENDISKGIELIILIVIMEGKKEKNPYCLGACGP